MKSKVTMLMILSLVLLCAGTMCGCGGGGIGACKDSMKMVPVDSTKFSYWNIGIMETDEDLWDVYYIFKESTEAGQIMDIGLARSSVSNAGKASGFSGLVNSTVRILNGDFDTRDVERGLDKKNYTKTTYQEIGIWSPPGGQGFKPVAVEKGTLLLGDKESLEASIDVTTENDKGSFYDNHNIKLVTDKLPDGVLIYVGTAASAGEESYEDLVAYGKSYRQVDELQLELTAIYMFQDAHSAGSAKDAVKDYLGTKDFTDIKVEREDSFIRVKAKIYISDFVATLVF